ncbi:MAG: V-type ATP synthase subunit F [bacterium]
MKFYVIGDAETVLGFSLAGIEGKVVANKEETREALNKAFNIEGIGIIIITERTAQTIRQQVDQHILKKSFPLIIEIPDRHGPVEGKSDIKDMVSKAVGISI